MYSSNKHIPSTDHYEVNETRTLLVTNIATLEDQGVVKEVFSRVGDIKETYTIPGRNILFLIFYDVRSSTRAKKTYDQQIVGSSKINVEYTVSKYEIPKDGDYSDETRNQGTLLLVSRDLSIPLTELEILDLLECYGEIKEIREYRPFQKFVEFYDARCAVKAFENFGIQDYKGGKLSVRFQWDMNKKRRWEFIKLTDDILSYSSSKDLNVVKRLQLSKETSKPKKNMIVESLDKHLLKNLEQFEKRYDIYRHEN